MSDDKRANEVIAGEYVLGLLSPDEAHTFEMRLRHDKQLRTAVRDARDRFLELDLTVEAGAPGGDLWQSIASALDAPQAQDTVGAFARKKRTGAGFWQGFGAASLAASILASFAIGALWPRLNATSPSVIVVLLDAQSKPGAIIEAFSDDSVRVVPLENFTVPDGRVIQLWTLPDAKTGPVSIGLLPGIHETKFRGPSLPKPKPDQLYEFTLEPAGGSPTGRPTGPILVKGFAKLPI
jgi:anti-sigma-K factor RskA